MGLTLKNPIIAGSSGLTSSLDSIQELERQGVAAIVLKSLFEEDLLSDSAMADHKSDAGYPFYRSGEYMGITSRHQRMEDYLELIRQCKAKLSIPVIASINCITPHEWMPFAARIEEAGADALEMNMFVLPSDPMKTSEDNEKIYFEILTEVRRYVKLPLSVKISPYFAGMTRMALKLSWTGIQGLILFNRYCLPDIDIDNIKLAPGKIFSSPEEYPLTLRWVGLLSDRVLCDIGAATGIHDASTIIKMLLAGARAVEVTSVLYTKGPAYIPVMLHDLVDWMSKHQFDNIAQFMGKLSLKKAENPAAYERFQYLKLLDDAAGNVL